MVENFRFVEVDSSNFWPRSISINFFGSNRTSDSFALFSLSAQQDQSLYGSGRWYRLHRSSRHSLLSTTETFRINLKQRFSTYSDRSHLEEHKQETVLKLPGHWHLHCITPDIPGEFSAHSWGDPCATSAEKRWSKHSPFSNRALNPCKSLLSTGSYILDSRNVHTGTICHDPSSVWKFLFSQCQCCVAGVQLNPVTTNIVLPKNS